MPPKVREFLEISGARPIAFTRFAQDALAEAGLDALYVPHGIDTTVFRPSPRAEARAALGISEDVFLVGMVAANKGSSPARKGWDEAFQAFAEFHRQHPDSRLYLHTELQAAIGLHLPTLVQACGIPAEAVIACDQYRYIVGAHPPEYLALAYSAMDVLLNPAYGEGFGIPIVEAQACGTPVIATDWTAMPELVGAGWLVDGDRLWTAQGSWWKRPRVGEIVEALEVAYAEQGKHGEAAREFALAYDARLVMDERWTPALAELEAGMMPLELPVAVGA